MHSFKDNLLAKRLIETLLKSEFDRNIQIVDCPNTGRPVTDIAIYKSCMKRLRECFESKGVSVDVELALIAGNKTLGRARFSSVDQCALQEVLKPINQNI
jgi:hypothetical protein